MDIIVDLLLAILHHFLVFTLAGLLAAEFALVRPGLSGASLDLLGRIDRAYGGGAMAIIVVGICRVLFGVRGWEFYVANHSFWGKMVAFVIVGALSSARPCASSPGAAAHRRRAEGEIGAVRSGSGRDLLPALVLVFAAAMARGVGVEQPAKCAAVLRPELRKIDRAVPRFGERRKRSRRVGSGDSSTSGAGCCWSSPPTCRCRRSRSARIRRRALHT